MSSAGVVWAETVIGSARVVAVSAASERDFRFFMDTPKILVNFGKVFNDLPDRQEAFADWDGSRAGKYVCVRHEPLFYIATFLCR